MGGGVREAGESSSGNDLLQEEDRKSGNDLLLEGHEVEFGDCV